MTYCPPKSVLVVGGGTAGWLAGAYLAKQLGPSIRIQLVESEAIGILGVGEGTFPTIRRTLARIGISETDLIRECGAAFKQGARFVDWVGTPGGPERDHYFHAFQEAQDQSGPELLPYWLLGAAGDAAWDEVATPQKMIADACHAPKQPAHPDFAAPLNYAYHFDAVALSRLLRRRAVELGVDHKIDTIDEVLLTEEGAISGVRTRENGVLSADLYIDCSGFRAELIGKALGQPWTSCRDVLFCDSAVALQVPYASANDPIASYTIATAKSFGWIWDIGLDTRRGVGHVFSSAHGSAEDAERILRAHIGPAARDLEARTFRFDAGYREVNWHKNCVAIGLSSGFFEPLEATGIVFSEVAIGLLVNLFPWSGEYETSARQFNLNMRLRYERALDFIKLHYCLTKRRDSDFWIDNASPASNTASLIELLDRWRHRPPNEMDVDPNVDIFGQTSWQYVLYGMGWKTDISPRAGSLRFEAEARAAFAEVRRQADYGLRNLPTNRDLVNYGKRARFGPVGAAA